MSIHRIGNYALAQGAHVSALAETLTLLDPTAISGFNVGFQVAKQDNLTDAGALSTLVNLKDATANFAQATANKRPTFDADGLQTSPAIPAVLTEHDGTYSKWMSATLGASEQLGADSDYTIMAVFKINTGELSGTNHQLLCFCDAPGDGTGSNANGVSFYVGGSGQVAVIHRVSSTNTSAYVLAPNGSVSEETLYCALVRYTQSTGTLDCWLNEAKQEPVTSVTAHGGGTKASFGVWVAEGAANTLDGAIHCAFGYEAALSDANVEILNSFGAQIIGL